MLFLNVLNKRGNCMHVVKATYESGRSKYVLLDDNFDIHEEALFFSNYLYSQGYSINTIEGYLRDIKKYLEYIKEKDINLDEVKPIHISQFIDFLKGFEQEGVINLDMEVKRSAATINRKLAAVSTFYCCLESSKVIYDSPFKYFEVYGKRGYYKSFLNYTQSSKIKTRNIGIRNKTTSSKYIRNYKNRMEKRVFPDEIKSFIEGLDTFRDKLIFEILYETGMRIGELLSLKINAISEIDPFERFGNIYIIYDEDNDDQSRQQKSGSRTIPVTMKLITMIDDYITSDRPYVENQEYVFVSHAGKTKGLPINRRTIEKVFTVCSAKTYIKCTPHMLRHTHLTELSENGFDDLFIKARAGHRSIYSTQKYTHLSLEAQTKAYKRFIRNKGLGDTN